MASKYFKAFQFAKKVGPTIKGMKPTVGKAGKFVRQKIDLIKKAGKTQKKMGIDKFKELGADKTAKEILRMKVPKVREPKMFGGIVDKFKTKTKKPKTEIKKGPMKAKPDNKGQKMTPDQSKKLKEGIKEKILPKKKKDRLEELRKELK